MEYVRLGETDLMVSRLGFGCEPLGGTDWGATDPAAIQRAVGCAYDAGINFFDTADVYGLGRSEERLAQALGNRRKDVVIATKFGVAWTPGLDGGRARTHRDASPAAVVRCLEASLLRLQLEQIPLYQLHWPDPATPIEATLEALARCVKVGKIRYVGACNVSAEAAREMHAILPLTSLQMPFNLIEASRSSDSFTLCRERGIGSLAWGCLAQGLLTGKYRATDKFGSNDRRSRLPHFQPARFHEHESVLDRLTSTAAAFARTPAQTAVRWVLDSGVDVAIVGAKTERQLDENLGALGWTLPPDVVRGNLSAGAFSG